jgi:hypothetical protein
MGHSKYIGGSVKIELSFERVVDPKLYLQIIDSLDHCVITDSEELASYSLRHFLLNESKNLYYDVCAVIRHMIKENNVSESDSPSEIKVTLCKSSFVSALDYSEFPQVINYHIEG